MLKTTTELLQKEDNDLFGKKFCNDQISKTVEAHKQKKELLASTVFKDLHSEN